MADGINNKENLISQNKFFFLSFRIGSLHVPVHLANNATVMLLVFSSPSLLCEKNAMISIHHATACC